MGSPKASMHNYGERGLHLARFLKAPTGQNGPHGPESSSA